MPRDYELKESVTKTFNFDKGEEVKETEYIIKHDRTSFDKLFVPLFVSVVIPLLAWLMTLAFGQETVKVGSKIIFGIIIFSVLFVWFNFIDKYVGVKTFKTKQHAKNYIKYLRNNRWKE